MTLLVSIIIPLFNAEKYLIETLNSILVQKYPKWECLIIDDGSSDSSEKIARKYCKEDNRFSYYFQANSGPSAARNKGIKLSKGDFILFLDADDVILPDMLNVMVNQNENVDKNVILYSNLYHGNHENIYETSAFRRNTNLAKDVTFNEMYRMFGLDFLFIPSCVFFPREAFSGIRWNEDYSHSEDWDLYLNILSNQFVFRYLAQPLIIYRNTPNSLSKNKIKTFEANYSILKIHINDKNLLFFSIRTAILLEKSIIAFLLKKTGKIIWPTLDIKPISLKIYIFFILIYPFTIYYLLSETVRIILKRINIIIR